MSDEKGRYEPVRRRRSHPAEVTASRLGDAVDRWHNKFSGAECDAIGLIIAALDEIAEGER